jgi:hypothetical protein
MMALQKVQKTLSVIPAKAGIRFFGSYKDMDPLLQGDGECLQ